jgi:hypothetical protein
MFSSQYDSIVTTQDVPSKVGGVSFDGLVRLGGDAAQHGGRDHRLVVVEDHVLQHHGGDLLARLVVEAGAAVLGDLPLEADHVLVAEPRVDHAHAGRARGRVLDEDHLDRVELEPALHPGREAEGLRAQRAIAAQRRGRRQRDVGLLRRSGAALHGAEQEREGHRERTHRSSSAPRT